MGGSFTVEVPDGTPETIIPIVVWVTLDDARSVDADGRILVSGWRTVEEAVAAERAREAREAEAREEQARAEAQANLARERLDRSTRGTYAGLPVGLDADGLHGHLFGGRERPACEVVVKDEAVVGAVVGGVTRCSETAIALLGVAGPGARSKVVATVNEYDAAVAGLSFVGSRLYVASLVPTDVALIRVPSEAFRTAVAGALGYERDHSEVEVREPEPDPPALTEEPGRGRP